MCASLCAGASFFCLHLPCFDLPSHLCQVGLLFVHYSVFDAGSGLSVECFTSMSNAARIAKKTCMKETPYHTACPSF